MLRVYLDWNVFSYLNNFKSVKEPYISLNRILTQNKDRILIPYTSAHLSDLITGYKKSEKARVKTHDDLSYLAELTNHLCIIHDLNKQITYPDQYDINEYFEQLLESDEWNSGDTIDTLFKSFEGEEIQSAVAGLFDTLKKLPIELGRASLKESRNNPPLYSKAFQDISSSNSFYDLLNSTYKLISNYSKEPTVYRNSRNDSLEELKLNLDYSKSLNPILEISENLKQGHFHQTFKEFADATLKNQLGDKEPSRMSIFTNYYMHLDFFGYYRDKVFKNMLQDSFHAFYGAHCDFFVTDDDNTYHKAKVIYDYLNIETTVCKTSEFIGQFYGKAILNSDKEKPISQIINEVLKTSFVIADQRDDKFNPVNIYKMDYYVLNYFNRLQVTYHSGSTVQFYLYKASKNYSSFYFFEEIASITNKVFLQYGIDLNGRAKYMPDVEKRELLENNWKGRQWEMDNISITLFMNEFPFGLTLSISLVD